MPTPPTCHDHREPVVMDYDHTAPRPDGYRLIYACPECGATDGVGVTMDEHRQAEYGDEYQ